MSLTTFYEPGERINNNVELQAYKEAMSEKRAQVRPRRTCKLRWNMPPVDAWLVYQKTNALHLVFALCPHDSRS